MDADRGGAPSSPPWAPPRDQPVPPAEPAAATAPPTRARPWWRLGVLAAGVVAGVLLVLALDDSVAVADLDVGDCASGVAFDGSMVHEVTRVDCDRAHEVEVYAVTTLDGAGSWPGDDEVLARARRQCSAAATGLLAASSGEWTIRLLRPSPESWSRGDRVVTCLLAPADDELTSGSVTD